MTDRLNSKNAAGVFEPFDINEVPWQTATKGSRFGMAFQTISRFGGGSEIGVSNEVLQPGQQANPLHYHLLEEEHVFVLEGSLTLLLGEKAYGMDPGHYVCFPAGQKVGHALVNRSDKPCRYLIIGKSHPHEVVVFPETGRVDVKLMGQGYKGDAVLGYWDGVDIGQSEA